MKPVIKIFHTDIEMAEKLADELQVAMDQAKLKHHNFYLAVSGGITPITFYKQLAQTPYQSKIAWRYLHLFWGDERCVPADNPQSNYGLTRYNLLEHLDIPERNIHRLCGEVDPVAEACRYAEEIKNTLPITNRGWPWFDWILLGLGNDGHTASLFPGSPALKEKHDLCAVSIQPDSGQKRITFTLPLINHARRITFLVTGESKAGLVADIINQTKTGQLLPAAKVRSERGIVEWYLDSMAATIWTTRHLKE